MTVLVQQDIIKLEIAVDDAARVQEEQTDRYLRRVESANVKHNEYSSSRFEFEELRHLRESIATLRTERVKIKVARASRRDTSFGYNRFSFRIRNVRKFDNVNRSREFSMRRRSHVVVGALIELRLSIRKLKRSARARARACTHTHTLKYSHCHWLFKFATLLYLVHQIAAVHVFHHEVQAILKRKAESGSL